MANIDICKQIIALDNAIRFAGVASMKGKILAAEYREGVTPLLTRGDSELAIIHTLVRMGTRQVLEEKLGKTIYAFALYQKLKRASIMTYDESGRHHAVVMVSFDREANRDFILP
jgi:hypothetical protein